MRGGGVNDGKAIAKFALLWNACLALFFLIVNALPYALLGEWEAFAAGIAMLAQDTSWNDNLPRIVYRTVKALALQDWLSNLLFLAWLLFAVLLLGMVLALRLGIFKAGPRPLAFLSGAVLFELCVLTLVVPFSIEAMILAKRFWSHYMQLFAPFAALGAVCLYVLVCQANPRHLDLPIMHKAAALLLALLLVSGPVSNLKTKVRHPQPDTTPESLAALLDELGQEGDFLAPYNIYVHWRLNQHRHGFPHVTHTVRIIGATPWRTEEWRGLQVPAHFRLPTSLEGYCRMLDDRGPRLVVFFTPPRKASREGHNPLLDCELREYALHDLSAGPLVPYDVSHYFLRR